MGTYTGLRCKVIVKENYRQLIDYITNVGDWSDIIGIPFVEEFAKLNRSVFIPHGVLEYMPDSWEESTDFSNDFNNESGLWVFQCSLKNYDNEIEQFFKLVLENIVDRIIHLETFHEEDMYSKRWDFIEGKICCVDHQFINYKEE